MKYKLVSLAVLGVVMAACSNTGTTATGTTGSSTPASAASSAYGDGYGRSPASAASAPAAAPAAAAATCGSVAGSGAVLKGTKTVSGSSITIEADNDGGQFYFSPTCLKGGGTVTITIKDVGSLPHNFSISSLGINQDLTPGKSATVSVKFPASGGLQFFCEYHHGSGMRGALLAG